MKRVAMYKLVELTFCLAIAVSALMLVPATMNYLELYVALSHMYLRINSFDIYPDSTGESGSAVVSANFSIVQNSSYAGLKALSINILVYYNERAGYSDILFSRKFTVRDARLGPHSSLDLITANETYVEHFSLFADYNNQSMARGDPVKLLFSSDINLYLLGSQSAETVYLDDVTYQMPYYVS